MKTPIYDNLWYTPNVGSQGMTRLADEALNNYYMVESFVVTTEQLDPVDNSSLIPDQMKEIFVKYGGIELNAAMRDDLKGYRIIGIELYSETYNENVFIKRHGELEFSNNSSFSHEIYQDIKEFFVNLCIGTW